MAVYIEKQVAIDKLCHVDEYNSRSVAAIKEMKPADVRPVIRGRWIKLYENPLDGTFYCSNCKETIDIADGSDTPLKIGLYFCNNCGADMKENKNEKG